MQARIGIQFPDQCEQFAFRRRLRQDVRFGKNAEFGAGFFLAPDIDLGGGIFADAHKSEAGCDPALFQRGDACGKFALGFARQWRGRQ